MEAPQLRMVALLLVISSRAIGTTTESTISDEDTSTILSTAEEENSTSPIDSVTTTLSPPKPSEPPFTIRVPPMEDLPQSALGFEAIPAQLSDYVYEVKEGDLQDIGAEESNHHNSVYIRFEAQKFKPGKEVEVTSFVADSETALNMDVEEAVADVRNRSGGADMISAFFVAPEDEVYGNNLDRRKVQERGDIVRPERYSGEPNMKGNSYGQNSLTNDVLAPLQAAVSLSHERDDENRRPILEKQMLKEMPVYKTTIEIQKSIPYEIKGGQMQPVKEELQKPQQQQYTENVVAPPVVPPIMLAYHVNPQYRAPVSPVYYKYPTAMYYIPQDYIGNYIMRHSHENTGGLPDYFYRPRSYYYLRYQPSGGNVFSQALQYPVPYTSPYSPQQVDVQHALPPVYQDIRQYPAYQDIKAIPAAYADVKPVLSSAPEIYKDDQSNPTAYQDMKDSYEDERYAADAYESDKTITPDYQVIKSPPQTTYHDVRLLPPSDYQETKSAPTTGNQESKSINSNGYPATKNIPVTYQTIKVIPATYPAIKVNAISYPELNYLDGSHRDEDQNSLHSEQVPKIVKLSQVSSHPNQIPQDPPRSTAPFRPSQHVFSSVYPPYTYRVPLMLTARGRGIHARSVRSKQLCVEYGGFKPPMVPSVQIDEKELPQQAQEKSAVVEDEKKES